MNQRRIAQALGEYYLPNLASVLDVSSRLCAGGVLPLCAIARPPNPHRGGADYLLLVQERSGNVINAARRLAVIPKGFHEPLTDLRSDAQIGATLRREMEEEIFGCEDVDSTVAHQRRADPTHPSRLSESIRWLMGGSGRLRMECTGFGLNLISGNYEFASLIVIEDEEFWSAYGGRVEANWESSTLRQYSSRDRELLAELNGDVAWSNEGLFALLQGLRRLRQIGENRVNLPSIEGRYCRVSGNWSYGNAADDGYKNRGWLLGHFIDPSEGVRSTKDVEVKWGIHPAGDKRPEWTNDDQRTTLVLLVEGNFRVNLTQSSITMSRQGDYVMWRPGIDHSWEAISDSVVITVRWPSAS